MKTKYLNFEDARRFVHSLNLSGQKQWCEYCKSGKKPDDIPYHPDRIYKNSGWNGMGDWLGNHRVANKDKQFRSFEDAKKFVHSQNLNTYEEWKKYCKSGKKPEDIPSAPNVTYKSEWKDFRDWLGTKKPTLKKKYRDFDLAKEYVKRFKIKNQKEWNGFTKSKDFPDDIPKAPRYAYADKWISWGDWLGTNFISYQNRNHRSFVDARSYAQKQNLQSMKKWIIHTKTKNFPKDIPAYPNQTYRKKGWISWGDFLIPNYDDPRLRKYRSFNDARKYVHSLGIKNQKEWIDFIHKENFPKDIPSFPWKYYANKGWTTLDDFLGHGRISTIHKNFRSFNDARKYVHSLGIKNQKEWNGFTKSKDFPNDIPKQPWEVYANKGWVSLDDFLGHGRISNFSKSFLSYDDARKFARENNIKSASTWFELDKNGKLPSNLPSRPDNVYANKGWTTWGDFLGTGRISDNLKEFRSFTDARKFARSLKYTNVSQWQKFANSNKRPKDIPSDPSRRYKKEWKGWGDFLGNFNISFAERSKKWLPWEDAKHLYQEYAKKYDIKTKQDWLSFIKIHKLPTNLPPYPESVYTKKRALRNSK